MKKGLLKAIVIVAALGLLGYLFVRSVQQTRSEPYQMQAAHLQGWTFAIEPGNAPNSVLLAMHPPRDAASGLFRQLFTRAAESMNGPSQPAVPLLLQDEFNRSFAGQATTGDLLALAREAGLDALAFRPRCMASRRESAPGVTRQLYFVLFESPAFERFRARLAERAIGGTGFDPGALSPVMFVASSDADFNRWLPVRVEGASECVAPIEVQ